MTDSLIIRKANLDDLEPILALLNSPMADNGNAMSQVDAGLMLQTMLDDSNYFQIVATADSGIVGMLTLVIIMQMSHEGATPALITDLIVSGEEESYLITRQLLEYATNLAQEYGCYKTILQTDFQAQLSTKACIELGYKQGQPSFSLFDN